MPSQRERVLEQAKHQLIILTAVLIFSLMLAFGCGATIAGRLNSGWIAAGWGFAFFLPAFIIGMLFGIPKNNDNAASEKKTASALTMNGNFAQISDWITKMITGVTLVSAKNIPSYVYRAGQYIGLSLTGKTSDAAASTGSAIAVLFSGLGFIAGYLFTSIYLTVVLEDTAQSLNDVAAQLSPEEKSALEPDADSPGQAVAKLAEQGSQNVSPVAQKAQKAAVQKLRYMPVDPSANADALELLGNAKMSVGKFDEAELAFSEAIKKNASWYRLRQSLATARFRQKKFQEAVEAMESGLDLVAGEVPSRILAFYEVLVEYCLHLPAPANYEKCMKYAQQFLSRGSDADKYGGVSIDYANAYGLKAAEKRRSDPNANIDEEATAARKLIDYALKMSPDWRHDIQSFMNPAADEHYLAVFRNDPAFADLTRDDS
jgi:tetratricopeptide (TPR) repeat protein